MKNANQDLLRNVSRFCLLFYLLPLPVLTPTFISLVTPKDANVTQVARYMNIVFVIVIEAMATISDLLLLRRFTANKSDGQNIQQKVLREMWIIYIFIWLSICSDVTAKVSDHLLGYVSFVHYLLAHQLIRNFTGDLIPDLAITNLTISMRAVANLRYGTSLKSARQILSSFGSSNNPLQAKPFSTGVGSTGTNTFVGNDHKYPDTLVIGSPPPPKPSQLLSDGRTATVNLSRSMV
jgi:hypothetical protein